MSALAWGIAALLLAAWIVDRQRLTASLARERAEVARLRLESTATNELLAAIVHDAPTATMLLDGRGLVRFANRAARTMFLAGSTATGASLADVLRTTPEPLRRALGGEVAELVALEKDGEREIVHVSKRPFAGATASEALTVVTAQPLTHALLREEVSAYKKLVRVLAHEWNNSLAPIGSLASSAKRLVAAGNYDSLDTLLATIGERVEHLRSFLNRYAAVARVPSPRKTSVALGALFDRLARLFPGIRVDAPERGEVFADESQLEQVLVNLVKNSLEASSAAEEIEVVAEASVEGAARIIVRDRGSGLTEDVLASALVPFFTTKEGGAGLGLAVSREIVEGHGGRLRLRAREGGGAEVVVRLPGPSGAGVDALTLTLG